MVSAIIPAMIPVVLGVICLIWPGVIYTFYRNNHREPDWLPATPTTKEIIVVRLIGILTLSFMFVILKPLFIKLYIEYVR